VKLDFVSGILPEDEITDAQQKIAQIFVLVGGCVDKGELARVSPSSVVVGQS
jgi:hypothetical protein